MQKLKIRGLRCMNSDDTKMMDSRSFKENCVTWFYFGTWAVFSNKMQLDYLKMDELREVIRNSEGDSNDI